MLKQFVKNWLKIILGLLCAITFSLSVVAFLIESQCSCFRPLVEFVDNYFCSIISGGLFSLVLFLLLKKFGRATELSCIGKDTREKNTKKWLLWQSIKLANPGRIEKIKEIADGMYPAKSFDTLNAEQLIKWAGSDSPIEESGKDYFGYAHFAKKIAIRLRPRYNNGRFSHPSFGIRGGFGSGKSSIVNMAEQILAEIDPQKFIFCKISCWGFENSLTAQKKCWNK